MNTVLDNKACTCTCITFQYTPTHTNIPVVYARIYECITLVIHTRILHFLHCVCYVCTHLRPADETYIHWPLLITNQSDQISSCTPRCCHDSKGCCNSFLCPTSVSIYIYISNRAMFRPHGVFFRHAIEQKIHISIFCSIAWLKKTPGGQTLQD